MGGTGSSTCHSVDPLLNRSVAFASSHLHQMSTFEPFNRSELPDLIQVVLVFLTDLFMSVS